VTVADNQVIGAAAIRAKWQIQGGDVERNSFTVTGSDAPLTETVGWGSSSTFGMETRWRKRAPRILQTTATFWTRGKRLETRFAVGVTAENVLTRAPVQQISLGNVARTKPYSLTNFRSLLWNLIGFGQYRVHKHGPRECVSGIMHNGSIVVGL